MELLKYVLAVAVGAFMAGVGAIVFIDQRIDEKLAPQVQKIEGNVDHRNSAPSLIDGRVEAKLKPYITKTAADAAYVKEPFSERLIELQRVVDKLGQSRSGPTFDVTNPRTGGRSGQCPAGGVGGNFAVDGISRISVTCAPLR